MNKNVRLSGQAVIAMSYTPDEDTNRLVKKIAIDKLQEESKKLGIGFQDPSMANQHAVYYESLSTAVPQYTPPT